MSGSTPVGQPSRQDRYFARLRAAAQRDNNGGEGSSRDIPQHIDTQSQPVPRAAVQRDLNGGEKRARPPLPTPQKDNNGGEGRAQLPPPPPPQSTDPEILHDASEEVQNTSSPETLRNASEEVQHQPGTGAEGDPIRIDEIKDPSEEEDLYSATPPRSPAPRSSNPNPPVNSGNSGPRSSRTVAEEDMETDEDQEMTALARRQAKGKGKAKPELVDVEATALARRLANGNGNGRAEPEPEPMVVDNSNTIVVDNGSAPPPTPVKRGRGRPKGVKNKPKNGDPSKSPANNGGPAPKSPPKAQPNGQSQQSPKGKGKQIAGPHKGWFYLRPDEPRGRFWGYRPRKPVTSASSSERDNAALNQPRIMLNNGVNNIVGESSQRGDGTSNPNPGPSYIGWGDLVPPRPQKWMRWPEPPSWQYGRGRELLYTGPASPLSQAPRDQAPPLNNPPQESIEAAFRRVFWELFEPTQQGPGSGNTQNTSAGMNGTLNHQHQNGGDRPSGQQAVPPSGHTQQASGPSNAQNYFGSMGPPPRPTRPQQNGSSSTLSAGQPSGYSQQLPLPNGNFRQNVGMTGRQIGVLSGPSFGRDIRPARSLPDDYSWRFQNSRLSVYRDELAEVTGISTSTRQPIRQPQGEQERQADQDLFDSLPQRPPSRPPPHENIASQGVSRVQQFGVPDGAGQSSQVDQMAVSFSENFSLEPYYGGPMDYEFEQPDAEDPNVHMRGGALSEEDLEALGVAPEYDDEDEDVEIVHERSGPPLLSPLPIKPSSSGTAVNRVQDPPTYRSSRWTCVNKPARDPTFSASGWTPVNPFRHDPLPQPHMNPMPVHSPDGSDSEENEDQEPDPVLPLPIYSSSIVFGPMTLDEHNARVAKQKEKGKWLLDYLQGNVARLSKGTHQQKGAAEELVERLRGFKRKLDWYALPEECRPPPSEVPRSQSPIDWDNYPIVSGAEENAADEAWRRAESAESRKRFLEWVARKNAELARAAESEERASATSRESGTNSDDGPVFANGVLVSPTPTPSL